MALGKKFGGRQKGTPNKIVYDVRGVIDRVFDRLGGEEKLIEEFLGSEDENIRLKLFMRLQEYRYGKPKETHDVNLSGLESLAEEIAAGRKRASQIKEE